MTNKRIGTERCAGGWRTVIDGEIGGKTSLSPEAAVTYGERVLAGFAKWESATNRSLFAVGKMDVASGHNGPADNRV